MDEYKMTKQCQLTVQNSHNKTNWAEWGSTAPVKSEVRFDSNNSNVRLALTAHHGKINLKICSVPI
jgi:ribosomal protein L28